MKGQAFLTGRGVATIIIIAITGALLQHLVAQVCCSAQTSKYVLLDATTVRMRKPDAAGAALCHLDVEIRAQTPDCVFIVLF